MNERGNRNQPRTCTPIGLDPNRTTPVTTRKKERCMLKGDSHIDTAAPEHEEGPSEAHQRLSSRRTFSSGSAKLLGGGALALGLVAAPAFAKDNDHDDEDDKKQGARETTAASQTSTSSTTPSF